MNSNFTGIDSKLRPNIRNESVMSESTSLKKRNQELFFNKVKRNASKNQNEDEARKSENSLFEDALKKLPVDTYG